MQSMFDERPKEKDQEQEWSPCNLKIKIPSSDSEITFNLTPANFIALSQEEGISYKVDLNINYKRFLPYEEYGYEWRTSWNIPDINCTLNIRDRLQNEIVIIPESQIYAEVYAVKKVFEPIQQTCLLENVGIRGQNRQPFENSQCCFKNIKFSSNAYQHQGQKFHLVVVVYFNQSNSKNPFVIDSQISRPIFVNYRTSPYWPSYNKKKTYLFNPFSPECLDRKYVKRESRKKQQQDIPIENDIEGLINFISAPNIRNIRKIKHPLFLAIKFSNCVKCFHNIYKIPENEDDQEFIKVLQNQLQQTYIQLKKNKYIIAQEKPLIIQVLHTFSQDSNKLEKINTFLQPQNENLVHVILGPQIIPNNFIELKDIESIKQAYKEIYPYIVKREYDSNEASEDSELEVEEEETSIKKIKIDQSELDTVTDSVQKLKINDSPQQIQIVQEQISKNAQQNGYSQQDSNIYPKISNQLQSILNQTQDKNHSLFDNVQLSAFANLSSTKSNLFNYQADQLIQIEDDKKYIKEIYRCQNDELLNYKTKLSTLQSENFNQLKQQHETVFQNQSSDCFSLQSNQQTNQETFSIGQVNFSEFQQKNSTIQRADFNPLINQQNVITQIGVKNINNIQNVDYLKIDIDQQNNNINLQNSPSQNMLYFEQDQQLGKYQNQFHINQIKQQSYCDYYNQQKIIKGHQLGDNQYQQQSLNQGFNNEFQKFLNEQMIQQPQVDDNFTQNNFIQNCSDSSTSQQGQNSLEEK
ncbi:hypothetical protein ABPG74_016994 [Tetrahymena malaccensis]